MNILYFRSHDTGRAIEPYGFDVSTPALKFIADNGSLFLDAHCAAPTCSDDPNDIEAPVTFLGDYPDVRRDWKDYANSAERLDSYYARILEVLEKRGFAEDTLVIVTTDHGVPFPEMKCSLTSRGTGVLLIMRLPEKIGKGIRSPSLVSHLDVFPTICELLDTPAPDWLQGNSLMPILSGSEDAKINDMIFAEVFFHAAFEPKRLVRSKRWCYIRNFAPPP